MTATVPIPAYEHLFLPAPAWLLVALSTFTFWLHLLLVGTVVGSLIYLFLTTLVRHNELDRRLNGRLLKVLPVCVSLTITFGVAPLLFTQALYGHYFYSANILIGNFWLGSLGFLLVGFISLYLAARFSCNICKFGFIAVVLGCFGAVLYIFTHNAILSLHPEYWLEFHRGARLLHVRDATALPRLAHNVGATFVISGLALAWIGRYRWPTGGEFSPQQRIEHATRTGLSWTLLGLMLQIAFGLWFVLSLPGEIRKSLINFSGVTSIAWYAGLLFVVLNIFTSMKGIINPGAKKWLIFSTILPLLGLVGMLLARQYLRSAYLVRPAAGGFDVNKWTVESQTQPMLIFALALTAALLVIIIMLVGVLLSGRTSKNAVAVPIEPRSQPPQTTNGGI